MKITYIVTECRDKVSPQCTKTFNREVKRGRPQVNCGACKSHTVKPTRTVISVPGATPGSLERTCPCGTKFEVKPGRGRKAEKCQDCRDAGTVYRENSDGEIEAIRAATLAEEAREKAEENGRQRAHDLTILMAPLLAKKHRTVIPH